MNGGADVLRAQWTENWRGTMRAEIEGREQTGVSSEPVVPEVVNDLTVKWVLDLRLKTHTWLGSRAPKKDCLGLFICLLRSRSRGCAASRFSTATRGENT